MYNYFYNHSYDGSERNSASDWSENTTDGAYRHESGALRHTHEYLGSVQIAAPQASLLHNHRFAGVTDEAIPIPGGHTHRFESKTDFGKGHFHVMEGTTGPSIPVGEGRHVHYAAGQSSSTANHGHSFRFATLIDDPAGTNQTPD